MYNLTPRELFTSRGIIWQFITCRIISTRNGNHSASLTHSLKRLPRIPPNPLLFRPSSLSHAYLLTSTNFRSSFLVVAVACLVVSWQRRKRERGDMLAYSIPLVRQGPTDRGSKDSTLLVPISRVKWAPHGVRPSASASASAHSCLPSLLPSFANRVVPARRSRRDLVPF